MDPSKFLPAHEFRRIKEFNPAAPVPIHNARPTTQVVVVWVYRLLLCGCIGCCCVGNWAYGCRNLWLCMGE